MSSGATDWSRLSIVLDRLELLPDSWRYMAGKGTVWTFNPALIQDGPGWVLAYRVVAADQARRIAICRLDRELRVVAGSQCPLTDMVRFHAASSYPERARTWFADPRLFRWGGRLFLYWNSGWHEPQNFQFVQELDAGTLKPIGHPRELTLHGERRPLEKNWTFFGEEPWYAVYSVAPHRVVRVALDGRPGLECCPTTATDWDIGDYSGRYGDLRGGAPPQAVGGYYYSFCHSNYFAAEGLRYVAAVYRFTSTFPFSPTDAPAAPLALPNPFGAHNTQERLNPVVGEVIYPCGAVFDQGWWTISYGINDEYCALARIPHAEVLSSLRPVSSACS